MQQSEFCGILLMDKPQGFTSHDGVAKLRGILSEGMILCASDEQGNLKLVTHEGDLPAGAEVR